MSRYLLDTGIALLAVNSPENLPRRARTVIEQGGCSLSVISYWEVMIKATKGSLDVGDPRQWWSETLNALALQVLPFRPEHVAELHNLQTIHQDPFDRALIAQATVENLTLVTKDQTIPLYKSDRFHTLD